ncbi:uncharacterized protein LOC126902459 [Daktulosphaira vitifoliae]|uniref:uncharacterized protein LOC126902459 n=1 Tax=Daktulosphaira vitifoliae TaxID=58002 RepID=UPI0021A9A5F8|nr:uncharacterized protein LOC126902459 [Daktulosphaira vitifoliae]
MFEVNLVMIVIVSAVTIWNKVVYYKEFQQLYYQQIDIVKELTGEIYLRPPRIANVFCWITYFIGVVLCVFDMRRFSTNHIAWYLHAMIIWERYIMVTAHLQFAVIVVRLTESYRILNNCMVISNNTMSIEYPFDVLNVKPLNTVFTIILDRTRLLALIKHWSDIHWSITQVVFKVNELFKFQLFLYFIYNLFGLILTPYLLSLTLLSEDQESIGFHVAQRTVALIYFLVRMVLLIIPCSLMKDEVIKTKILLSNFLNVEMDMAEIIKIETYVEQMEANIPEFKVYNLFVLDRPLVVTIAGVVSTYLVILLQIQSQF